MMHVRDPGHGDRHENPEFHPRGSNSPSSMDPSSASPQLQPNEDYVAPAYHNRYLHQSSSSGLLSNPPSGQSISSVSSSSQRLNQNYDPYFDHASMLGPPGRPPGSPERTRHALPPPHPSPNPWGSSTLIPALPQFVPSSPPGSTLRTHDASTGLPSAPPIRYPTSEYGSLMSRRSESKSGAYDRPHILHPAGSRHDHSPVRYNESTQAYRSRGWSPRETGHLSRDVASSSSSETSRDPRYASQPYSMPLNVPSGSQRPYQSQRYPTPTTRPSQIPPEVAWATQPNVIYPASLPTPHSHPQTFLPFGPTPHSTQRQSPTLIPELNTPSGNSGRHIRSGKRKLSGDDHSSPERKIYHPKAPQGGSDWVMWVGNIPSDTTKEDALAFFRSIPHSSRSGSQSAGHTSTSAADDGAGIMSIFLMLQSHCAFVNFSSEPHLQRALRYFNGRPFRNGGVKLVCRIRKKEEEIKSGVGAQRGLGFHRKWVKEHAAERAASSSAENGSTSVSTWTTSSETSRQVASLSESLTSGYSDESMASSTSTTSSLLATHFPIRYFVLKAMTKNDLHLSVETGVWATQVHNEAVLNQAFRTSQTVYLIFGANRAGEFHGYAKMETPIKSLEDTTASWSRDLLTVTSRSVMPTSSTSEGTTVYSFERHLHRYDSFIRQSLPSPTTSTVRSESPTKGSPPIASSFASSPTYGGPPSGRTERNEERQWGAPFRVKWIRVGSVPFHQTRMLRNPWNKDREVKVSRDGTELEPSVGLALIDFWDSVVTPDAPPESSELTV